LGRKEGWGLGGAWMETCWLYGAVYSKILAGAGGDGCLKGAGTDQCSFRWG